MRTRATAVAATLSLLGLGAAVVPSTAVAAPPGGDPPRQRYIVTTDSVSTARRAASDVNARGGRVDNTYSRVFSGFSATMSAEQVRSLKENRRVRSVTPDAVMHSSDLRSPSSKFAPVSSIVTRSSVQNSPTWGLDRIDQRPTVGNGSYRYDTTGAGVTAFVVDTGIRLSHTQFGSRAASGYDFVDYDKNASDCVGHGTHVSGTIGGSAYGAAKGVAVVAVRVLDCDGSGYASDIIDGLDWVIAHKPSGPAVVNMSLGGEAYPLLDSAVDRTVTAGIPVVVAAGNEGRDACSSSPARTPRAITVAATDSQDRRPEWSNDGDCVDLFAPGVGVRSASNTSNTATEVMSGTSMATPHVTGVVARYLQSHPKDTPAQTTAALLVATTPNVVKDPAGAPNRLLYAGLATPTRG